MRSASWTTGGSLPIWESWGKSAGHSKIFRESRISPSKQQLRQMNTRIAGDSPGSLSPFFRISATLGEIPRTFASVRGSYGEVIPYPRIVVPSRCEVHGMVSLIPSLGCLPGFVTLWGRRFVFLVDCVRSQEVHLGSAEQQQRLGQLRVCWQLPDRNRRCRRAFAPGEHAPTYRETALPTALPALSRSVEWQLSGTDRGSGGAMPRLPGHALPSVGRDDPPGSLGLLGDFESHNALKLSRQRVQKSV